MFLEDIFHGKSVLVTGHTGFKGSWLCLWLSKLGAKVHGYSLPPDTDPNHYKEARIHDLLASERFGNICDRKPLPNISTKSDLIASSTLQLSLLSADPIVNL
jgi:CDP-glucose 4,6-dehydratase